MNKVLFEKLVNKAVEMAMANKWTEKSFKINSMILEMDSRNSAACTRLAKYFKLNGNFNEAKAMYSKALVIDPKNLGAMNNLIEIETFEKDKAFVDELSTSHDAYDAARSLAQKGKCDLSVSCFIKAFSIDPILKNSFALAKTFRKHGRNDAVRKIYTQLINTTQSQEDIDTINAEFRAISKA